SPTVGGSVTVIEGETGVRLDNNGLLPTLGTPRGAISVSDPEGATINTYTIASLPAHGTLYYNGSPITAPGFVVNDITLLTYNHDGSETTADSFNVSVTDDGGGTGTPATVTSTISLNIHPNDDDPALVTNVTQTLSSGSTLTVTPAMLQVTDVDTLDPNLLTYTVTAVPNPADGYFKLSGYRLIAGATFTQADVDAGNLVYVSLSNTPRTDSISFTVKDGSYRIYPDEREGGIYDTPAQTSPLTVNTFSVNVSSTATVDPSPLPSPVPINTAPATGGANSASLLEGETITLDNTMLAATDEHIERHRELVRQADRLYGARHYNHYDFLLAVSDRLGGIGLEHHRSSENSVDTDYFTDPASTLADRDLLGHEYTHSWNGKWRRPADQLTPTLNEPLQNSLLWVYEGQTQYWGLVLTARAGLMSKQQALDILANTAATYAE
ncbi:MAG: hypothetical protein IE935_15220, partial [Micrococcales bacterium]|nr:hypothetical protein [Micrococcales bacterium]